MSKRDEYITKMKQQLDELNASMDTLSAKAHEAKLEAREKYATELAKLRQQSQDAKDKLEEMKLASEESWDTMVASVDKMKDALVHSFHYFKSQL